MERCVRSILREFGCFAGVRHRVLSDTVFELGTGIVASILAFRHETHEGLLL